QKVRAEMRDDITQAVVAAVSPALFQPKGAWRQVDLVVRNQDPLHRHLEKIAGGAHGLPGTVHEGHGLEKANVMAADIDPRHFAVEFLLGLETPAETAREFIDQPEAGVVAG